MMKDSYKNQEFFKFYSIRKNSHRHYQVTSLKDADTCGPFGVQKLSQIKFYEEPVPGLLQYYHRLISQLKSNGSNLAFAPTSCIKNGT